MNLMPADQISFEPDCLPYKLCFLPIMTQRGSWVSVTSITRWIYHHWRRPYSKVMFLLLFIFAFQRIMKYHQNFAIVSHNTFDMNSDIPGKETDNFKFLCHGYIGRLGNLLFQYASIYSIARSNYMIPVNKGGLDLKQLFKEPPYAMKDMGICSKARDIGEANCCTYQPHLTTFSGTVVNIVGYLQSWKYFEKYKDEIRQEIEFNDEIMSQARNHLKKSLEDKYANLTLFGKTFVGVHVRRGDMLRERFKKFGYKTAGKDYIDQAMEFFRDKFKDVIFVVKSDDLRWCHENIDSTDDVVFAPQNKAAVDMATLSLLNHTIMTVGTFGWWSAWLANGMTVYMEDFAFNNSDFAKQYSGNASDFFYPGWIPL